MLGELAPVGEMEAVLAARVVSLSWRLQRAERLPGVVLDAMSDKDTTGPRARVKQSLWGKAGRDQGETEAGGNDLVLGRVVAEDFANARVFDRLLRYERRIEHSLYRTMGELRKQRLMRENPPQEGAKAEGGSASSMGVSPMNAKDIHGQDARAAKPSEGGTPNAAPAEIAPSFQCSIIPGLQSHVGVARCGQRIVPNKPNVRQDKLGKGNAQEQHVMSGNLYRCPEGSTPSR